MKHTQTFCSIFSLLFKCLQQSEKASCLSDSTELDTKGLHLDKELLYIDNFVSNKGLQKHTNKSNQSVLHVLVLDILT
jgi:hypothetical protein